MDVLLRHPSRTSRFHHLRILTILSCSLDGYQRRFLPWISDTPCAPCKPFPSVCPALTVSSPANKTRLVFGSYQQNQQLKPHYVVITIVTIPVFLV
ncbi:hypothetical protein GDO86_012381 [Hymenochirus boettgeri]|uniref:Uncharacterized protein n=1 Tax=Hymenochirus boettgeri TaxID=247094 RepID=A0A8T2IM96_9PIPI|nr:hypothetical protein GDO86_012381 [Hymenochirus boettgeri]